MKAVIVYSGKGGVGKTTTIANIARLLVKEGKKVLIIDADINTPSMNTEFSGDHPEENLWIHSTGNMFDHFIYLEKAMVEQFLRVAKQKMREQNFDYVLVDTPPSITNIHISLLAEMDVSCILFVSQPTQLSRADVLRTAEFFRKQCGGCPVALVENMVFPESKVEDYGVPVVARIPFMNNFKTENLCDVAHEEYHKATEFLLTCSDTDVTIRLPPAPYDEGFDIHRIYTRDIGRKKRYAIEIKRDGEDGYKEIIVDKVKFMSLRTWKTVREFLSNRDDEVVHLTGSFRYDQRLLDNDTEHLRRMVEHFKESSTAYFMVTRAPSCEIHLLAGEIGLASLVTDKDIYYGMPRIKYMTSAGEIILFSDEVKPVDANEIALSLQDGYTLRTDGRYIPPFETLQEVANVFGMRVGMGEGWEKVYEFWQTH